jgi:hypothetical protein
LEMINIRGINRPLKKHRELDDLHECFNCKGCICEEVCKESEAKSFPVKEGEKVEFWSSDG